MPAKGRATADGRIVTVAGRYYAIDRDRRWDRTERAWRAIVLGKGRHTATAQAAIEAAYASGKGDEFIDPTVIGGYQGLTESDRVVSFNFRKDRPRQIVAALGEVGFHGFDRGEAPLASVTCMMEHESWLGLPFAVTPETPAVTLSGLLSERGTRQLRCAETEKYARVTRFFNGGSQALLPGEDHRLIPSPQVTTYDLKPEMSAPAVADAVVEAIEDGTYGFIAVNFANGDMVGHSGDLGAAVRAVEALDRHVDRVLDSAVGAGYAVLLTADHVNCDLMVDPETGEPHTQHTTNPVPLLVIDEVRWVLAPAGSLADVAPTALQLMGIDVHWATSGRSLLAKAIPFKPLAVLDRLDAA